jgi:acyl-CoA thioesterase I
MRILIFGDSITQGFYDSQGGWAQRVRAHFDSQIIANEVDDAPVVFNLGISGDTTKDILKRFKPETQARLRSKKKSVIVFAIGTNDTLYTDNGFFESTPEKYEADLKELTKLAREYSDKILFVSLFPVIDKLLQPFPWSTTGKCYSTERMELFNKVLKKHCKANQLQLVDLYKPFAQASDLNRLFFDGIHPNNKGHELIAGLVIPTLQKLLAPKKIHN